MQTDNIVNTQEIKKRLKEILEILMVNEVTKPLTPKKLKAILTALGPQFVELGRIMAEHNDILPKDYYDELYSPTPSKKSINYDRLEAIIENEYGASMDDVFMYFSKNPTYQSPLFQCHKAGLKDGPQVIVKIQDPCLKNYISEDVDLIKKALGVLRISSSETNSIDLNMIFDELWNISQKELNFFVEADNAIRFYKLNSGEKYIISPKVDTKYNTSNILVMEYIPGTSLNNNKELVSNGYKLSEISKILSENYIKQIFVDGFFHPYPDSTSILFYKSNIVWTNFTLMSEFSSYDLDALKITMESIASGDIDKVSNIIMSINTNDTAKNLEELKNGLHQILDRPSIYRCNSQSLPVTNIIKSLVTLLNKLEIYLPESYSHLLSGLISIENIVERLDPNIKLIDSIRNVILPQVQEPVQKGEEKISDNYNNVVASELIDKLDETANIPITPVPDINKQINSSVLDINIPSKEELLKLKNIKEDVPQGLQQKPDNTKVDKDCDKDLEQVIRNSLEKNNKLEEESKAPNIKNEKQVQPVHTVERHEHDHLEKSRVEFTLKIDASAIKSINKMSNNIIICLIALCFFIGSCFVLCFNNPILTIFGLPSIAILFFAISIIIILWLVVRILRK